MNNRIEEIAAEQGRTNKTVACHDDIVNEISQHLRNANFETLSLVYLKCFPNRVIRYMGNAFEIEST